MEYRIEELKPKILVGKKLRMSFAQNTTAQLWKSFMMQRGEIAHVIGSDLYSMQIYPSVFFNSLDPFREFEKWAAIEVSEAQGLPDGMEQYTLPPGPYAVFFYKGSSAEGAAVFEYILGTWLPASLYELDDRPHFEVLGSNYKNNDPSSEEEIWIPVKLKP